MEHGAFLGEMQGAAGAGEVEKFGGGKKFVFSKKVAFGAECTFE
jgi:hypothetical protein